MKHLIGLLKALFITISFLFAAAAQSSSLANVESELLGEIKQANASYNRQLGQIAKERQHLLQQLDKQENQLKSLSTQAASITRGQDEQNMSLDKLAQRLQSWKQQQDYLKHLLASIDPSRVIETPQQLSEYLSGFSAPIGFVKQDIALSNGQLIAGQSLSVGPAHWFISDDASYGGLISQVDQQWQLALAFDDAMLAELSAVFTHNKGVLAVDPSNNRSLVLAQNQESFSEHLGKGGIWVLPIMGFALLALIIALMKAVTLSRLDKILPLYHVDSKFLSTKKPGKYQGALTSIAQQYSGLAERQQRDDLLLDQLIQTKREIERGLTAIAVTASVAPLLGLLGTVSGMIQTFKLMTLFGAGDANAVSGGISESLVTTELGLIVAIPALIAHALMSRRCHHYMSALESYAVKLSHQETPIKEINEVAHVA